MCKLFCDIPAKWVEKLCCTLFLPPSLKPVLQQTRLLQVAWILTSYLLKTGVTPYTGFMSLATIQVCLGLVKCVKCVAGKMCKMCSDFVAKRRSTSCNTFLQPATAWFVARQVWLWVVKCAVLLFNSFCSIMSQNNSHIFVADFTVALEVWIYASRSWGRMISFGYDTNLRTCCREVFRRFHEK